MINEAILWGATGQAKVLRECLWHSRVKIIALFDNNRSLHSPFPDIPLFYGREEFESWLSKQVSPTQVGFSVAIGGNKGEMRLEIQNYLSEAGLTAIEAIHPTAFIAKDAVIGAGCQVLAKAVVCSEAILGKACIINTAATVDHECEIGDGVHICPGATLAGCVQVDPYAMIGAGAVILPRIKVGQGAIIGAGAVVIRDVRPFMVVAGNPAKELREIRN